MCLSQVKDITSKLICPPAMRLGSSTRGAKDVLKHSFFNKINWQQLEAKKLEMAFVPTISNPLDRSNFDELEEDDEDPALKWKEFIDPEHEGMWASEFGPLESRT